MSETSIILVHGAWADGSSWAKVVPLLVGKGLRPIAVQLPLTSLADDAAVVRRAISLVDGPIVLVGLSYGGAVITEVGSDPKVKSLVYIAAFAPDAGESPGSLGASVEPSPLGSEIRPDAEGFLKITEEGFKTAFAQDLDDAEKEALYAAQGPTNGAALGAPITVPAWKEKPSWYAVAKNDGAIQPSLERTMASRIGATTIELEASHLAMLSKPSEVANLIGQAAA